MHKPHRAVAAVHIAYLIIHAGVAHIEESSLGFIKRVEKLGFPNPFAVKIIGYKNCRVISVECKFVFFHCLFTFVFQNVETALPFIYAFKLLSRKSLAKRIGK